MRRTGPRTPLTRADWRLVAISIVAAAIAIAVIARYYESVFPSASIDFRYDRNGSLTIAERFLAQQGIPTRGMKHAARFDSDESARIFLERSMGLEKANRVMHDKVLVWFWHHRWFRPLVEEEFTVDVAPTGEVVAFNHVIPEDRALPATNDPARVAGAFLAAVHVDARNLKLVSVSERRLPHRLQRIYTWDAISVRPASAPYRHTVTIDGNVVSSYSQRLKVPDQWLRSQREVDSKKNAASAVDLIFFIATGIAAIVIFVIRLRRGQLPTRFLLAVGIASVILVTGVALNSLPAQLADYDTTTSYPAFVASLVVRSVLQSLGTAMLLMVIAGAGEILYRESYPGQLAIPRLWTPRSLSSRRVFLSLIVGYALVPLFIAYQVVFYLVARRFGAWAPAEVPYDEMLNSALPFVAVLFAGFFPAVSEEFLSRAFSIPFFQRLFRSRVAAVVLAGFIWGFGHATYPNEPFYIRGLEVGFAGIIAGIVMLRFGLLPLLIWHYTIDSVYTAGLLFTSHQPYYVASAALASLIFAVPLIASILLYIRDRGFAPDDELLNASIPEPPPLPPHVEPPAVESALPPAIRTTRRAIAIAVALTIAAAIAVALRPSSPDDALDYRINKREAKALAAAHLRALALVGARAVNPAPASTPLHVVAIPFEGFTSWDANAAREEGGGSGDFDDIAATYLVHHGMTISRLVDVFRHRIEAGTWIVRFFRPMEKEEYFVEVDPRSARVVSYHKYQDERTPGPALSQDAALLVATAAFPRYGVDPRAFALKEALAFEQPARLDWLLHFEEKTPLAGQAFRRVTVRVAGAEVTQFRKHIKVPESVYREANTQTLLNVVLFAMKLIGTVALLAMTVAGLVIASRSHGLPWKRALRWTAILAILPVITIAAEYESMLFGYSTSVAWETFRVQLVSSLLMHAGLQIGLLFLAIAGLAAAVPGVESMFTRDARSRFGAAAVVSAVTAIAILTLGSIASRLAAHLMPAVASVDLAVPLDVAIPFPAIVDLARAAFAAIVGSAAIVLFVRGASKHVTPIAIAAVFFANVDPLATPAQVPVMLIHALLLSLLVWAIARYVLARNPLAWPAAIFLGAALPAMGTLVGNHRPDLIANGVALVVVTLAVMVWFAAGTRKARIEN